MSEPIDLVRLAIDILIGGSTVVFLLRRIFRSELKTALLPLSSRVDRLETAAGITGPVPVVNQVVAGG